MLCFTFLLTTVTYFISISYFLSGDIVCQQGGIIKRKRISCFFSLNFRTPKGNSYFAPYLALACQVRGNQRRQGVEAGEHRATTPLPGFAPVLFSASQHFPLRVLFPTVEFLSDPCIITSGPQHPWACAARGGHDWRLTLRDFFHVWQVVGKRRCDGTKPLWLASGEELRRPVQSEREQIGVLVQSGIGSHRSLWVDRAQRARQGTQHLLNCV